MAGRAAYVWYEPPYSSLTPQLIRLLVGKGVGRNGWAVMMALCMGVHVDRTFDMKPASRIAELTGLTEKQVSRGVAELRRLSIIVPVTRKAKDGTHHIDRSCFGHVATYCFTKDAWQLIEDGFKSREQQAAEGEQGARHSESAGYM